METPHCFGIAFRRLARNFLVSFDWVFIVVLVYKIIPRVVRRVYVYHLHFSVVRRLENFQNFQIVALYIKVFRVLPIHAFFPTRTQSPRAPSLRQLQTVVFPFPLKLIFFKIIVYIFAAYIKQFIYIEFSFRKTVGKHAFQLFSRLKLQISAHSVYFLHSLTHHIRILFILALTEIA